MDSFIVELKRRNVFRVAIFYAVVGWVLMQLGVVLETSLNLPPWFDTLVTVLVLLGFPVALILAWLFEMTPKGIKRTISAYRSKEVILGTSKPLYVLLGIVGIVSVGLGLIGWKNLNTRPDNYQQDASPQIAVTHSALSESLDNSVEDFKQSIAVLPFDDFSQDQTEDYFARGISEELLNVLSRINGLRVASRTSAFALTDEGKNISEIAQQLNVAYVLEGSIRKAGETIRVRAQIIDTATDEHIWSETYDRALTVKNLFEIQDEITVAIVNELKGKLTIVAPETTGRTLSLDAYDEYLKAIGNRRQSDPDSLKAAEEGFKRVIQIDPGFAPGYSGLADTYLSMRFYSVMNSQDAVKFATPNVTRALELDPNSVEALTSAAYLAYIEGSDIEAAIAYADQAIASNPSYLSAYIRKGQSHAILRQYKESLGAYQQALAIEPKSLSIRINIQSQKYRMGDLEAARLAAEAIIRNHPDSYAGYLALGDMLNDEGKYLDAHYYWKEAEVRSPEMVGIHGRLAHLYAEIDRFDLAGAKAVMPRSKAYLALMEGDAEEALAHITEMRRTSWILYFYYLLNNTDRAYELIDSNDDVFDTIDWDDLKANAGNYAIKAHILQEKGDPRAETIISALGEFFKDAKASGYINTNDISAGFKFHMVKGDLITALSWIDHMHNLGIHYPELHLKLFREFHSNPEFSARILRDKELRTALGAQINDQLIHAPSHWLRTEIAMKDNP